MTTPTSDLTDRYVWAVVRLLPEHQRVEVDRAVRSRVVDAIEARGVVGPDVDVERAALLELGNPSRLAAQYVERPRALVAPEVFPAYVHTLKLVAVVVIPLVAVLSVIGALAEAGDDPTFGDVFGAAVSGAYHAALQVAVWVTVAYAFTSWAAFDRAWTPDLLPDRPSWSVTGRSTGPGVVELVIGIVMTALAAVALVWQQLRPMLRDDDGTAVPFLDPDLWGGAGQALVALLIASIVVQAVVVIAHRWTLPLALANLVINLATWAVVAWASFGGWFLNERFFDIVERRAEWDGLPSVSAWIPVVMVGIVVLWDSAEALFHARRASRSPAEGLLDVE